MTDKARIRIAAAVTALFLAGISAAGLAARDDRTKAVTTATQPAAATSAPTAARDASAQGVQRNDGDRYEAVDDRYEAGGAREDDE